MLRTSTLAIIAGFSASAALAGGIERSPQSVALLFEEGGAVQFSFGIVSPSVSGTVGAGTVSSGDMAPTYTSLNFGIKQALTDRLDLAVIFDQSLGADVDYTGADALYPARGVEAVLAGSDLTALLRYRVQDRFSIYGGLRAQSITADLTGFPVVVPGPAIAPYSLNVDRTYELGYVLGAAYEIPEIALRVALTYNSAIDHNFDSTEVIGTGAPTPGTFTTTIPQSVNLEFQSGIAADTLLFGSIRWQDWSEFDISPPGLPTPLIDYQSDYTTYTLGIGRRFNEQWSGAITLGYEGATGDLQGNLAPRDGFASIGIGATYTMGNTEITGGVRYIALGDATTVPPVSGDFTGNDAWAAGIRVLHKF